MKLLTPGRANHKVAKGDLKKYESAILHLAPHTLAGGRTVCPDSSVQCRATCLYWAGRGQMPGVIQARVERTKMYLKTPAQFHLQLGAELTQLSIKAVREGRKPVVRLDGTSDLGLGDNLYLQAMYPNILFYDYTKSVERYDHWLSDLGSPRQRHNRYLAFSRSETNWEDCVHFLGRDGTVTVVFWPRIPKTWQSFKVINGDKHDFRFLDPPGVIVGLLAKGKAKKLADPTGKGFVVQV